MWHHRDPHLLLFIFDRVSLPQPGPPNKLATRAPARRGDRRGEDARGWEEISPAFFSNSQPEKS